MSQLTSGPNVTRTAATVPHSSSGPNVTHTATAVPHSSSMLASTESGPSMTHRFNFTALLLINDHMYMERMLNLFDQVCGAQLCVGSILGRTQPFDGGTRNRNDGYASADRTRRSRLESHQAGHVGYARSIINLTRIRCERCCSCTS